MNKLKTQLKKSAPSDVTASTKVHLKKELDEYRSKVEELKTNIHSLNERYDKLLKECSVKDAEIAEREKVFAEYNDKMEARKKAIEKAENGLNIREAAIDARESKSGKKEVEIVDREATLNARDSSIISNERLSMDRIIAEQEKVRDLIDANDARVVEIEAREARVVDREAEIASSELRIAFDRTSADEKLSTADELKKSLEREYSEVSRKSEELDNELVAVRTKNAALRARLDEKNTLVEERKHVEDAKIAIEKEENRLRVYDGVLTKRKMELKKREKLVEEREAI